MPLPPRKAMSWQSDSSGGALVRPAGVAKRGPVTLARIGPSPFLSRVKRKALPDQSEDDVKTQLIAEILVAVFGSDGEKSLPAHTKGTRAEGETWQGAKNRWFGIRNGRVVPVKNPNAEPKKPKEPKPGQAPRAPAKIHRMTLDQARETMAELKAQGPTEERLEVLVASLATLTVKDLEQLKKEVGAKGGKLKADLIAKIRGTLGEVRKADAEGDVESDLVAPPESQPHANESSPTTSSTTKAPTEKETWGTLASSWKQVYRRNIRKGGTVTIPELVDAMTVDNPHLTPEGIRDLLWKWKKNNDIVLQVCNDPRLEPRASEGIRGDKGVYLYVKMDPDAPAPQETTTATDTPPPKADVSKLPAAVTDMHAELSRQATSQGNRLYKVGDLRKMIRERIGDVGKGDVDAVIRQLQNDGVIDLRATAVRDKLTPQDWEDAIVDRDGNHAEALTHVVANTPQEPRIDPTTGTRNAVTGDDDFSDDAEYDAYRPQSEVTPYPKTPPLPRVPKTDGETYRLLSSVAQDQDGTPVVDVSSLRRQMRQWYGGDFSDADFDDMLRRMRYDRKIDLTPIGQLSNHSQRNLDDSLRVGDEYIRRIEILPSTGKSLPTMPPSPFLSRVKAKAMPPSPVERTADPANEDDEKAELIAAILDATLGGEGEKSLPSYSKAAPSQKHPVDVPYQTPGGAWRVVREFAGGKLRSVPAKAPGGPVKPAKKPTGEKPIPAPKKPKPIKISVDDAAAKIDDMRRNGTSEEKITSFIGELATLTVPDLKKLAQQLNVKPGKLKKDELVNKVRDVMADFAVPEDVEQLPGEDAVELPGDNDAVELPEDDAVSLDDSATTPEPEPAPESPAEPEVDTTPPDLESAVFDDDDYALAGEMIADGTAPPELVAKVMKGKISPATLRVLAAGMGVLEGTPESDRKAVVVALKKAQAAAPPKPPDGPAPRRPRQGFKDEKSLQDFGKQVADHADNDAVRAEVRKHSVNRLLYAKRSRELLGTIVAATAAGQTPAKARAEMVKYAKMRDEANNAAAKARRDAFLPSFFASRPEPNPFKPGPDPKTFPNWNKLDDFTRFRIENGTEPFGDGSGPRAAWEEASSLLNGLSDPDRNLDNLFVYRDKTGREQFRPQIAGVCLSDNSQTDIVAHEMTHYLETQLPPEDTARIEAFRAKRFSDKSKDVDMGEFNKAMRGEKGNADDMAKLFGPRNPNAAYAGKTYGNGMTETFTVGVEMLMNDPAKFARVDPEYFSLTMSLLQRVGK